AACSFFLLRRLPLSTLFPYTTLFRSHGVCPGHRTGPGAAGVLPRGGTGTGGPGGRSRGGSCGLGHREVGPRGPGRGGPTGGPLSDRLTHAAGLPRRLQPSSCTSRSKIAWATAGLGRRGNGSTWPLAWNRVTRLVSASKPLPGSVTSLATIRSRPLALSLAKALVRRSLVSAAKPILTKGPSTDARISGLRTRRSVHSSAVPFLSFSAAAATGRKSATAAAMIRASAPATALFTAASISWAEATCSTWKIGRAAGRG